MANRSSTDPPDQAERIAAAWKRERPGTPVASIGVITRIFNLEKYFREARRRELREAGVDEATLDLLSTLRRAGGAYTLTTREIANRTLVTAGAISQRIARAERQGLVRRWSEGRTVFVALTDAGHETVEHTVDIVLGSEDELLRGLPKRHRDELAELLRRLLASLPPH